MKREPRTTLEMFEAMTALETTWYLLWDRKYGPWIQAELRAGRELTPNFCLDTKLKALEELERLEYYHKQIMVNNAIQNSRET